LAARIIGLKNEAARFRLLIVWLSERRPKEIPNKGVIIVSRERLNTSIVIKMPLPTKISLDQSPLAKIKNYPGFLIESSFVPEKETYQFSLSVRRGF
jgi:hypothetical protein